MGQSFERHLPGGLAAPALDVAVNETLPALAQLQKSFERKARAFKSIVKSGRTHLMDAVPSGCGAEFAGYAAQNRAGPRSG